jgi:transposase
MKVRTLGIDLAKNVFLVHGVDSQGKTVVQRELRRRQVVPFMEAASTLPSVVSH